MRTKRSTFNTPKKRTISDSYRQAVEKFRQWSENISAREEDFKKGKPLRHL